MPDASNPGPSGPAESSPSARQAQQGGAHLFRHVPELPPDLVAPGRLLVGRGEGGGLRGVGGGSERVRAHVRDTGGLPGGAGRGHGGWRLR